MDLEEYLENYLTDSGFIQVHSGIEWLSHFPPQKYGCYRPQPSDDPDYYPAWFKVGMLENNPEGADIQHVCILY